MLPERSHYFDVGVDQTAPGLDRRADTFYKSRRNLIDDGQFGQAVVLTQFNYAQGFSEGGEFKLKYTNGNFNAYANFAYNITRAIDVESNQYLFDFPTYAYLLNNYHYTDDMQRMTGSAGVSYRWYETLFAADLIYAAACAPAISRRLRAQYVAYDALRRDQYRHRAEFRWSSDYKPATIRFDIVNLFDRIYELRDGSGIGVFAPQYGSRRGYYIGISRNWEARGLGSAVGA